MCCSPDVGVHSIGAFRRPPRSGVAFPTTSGLYCLEVCWQLHRGFSECPLGRVWSSLPHLVSNPLGSAGNCIGGFQGPLGRVWPSLPHLVSNPLEFDWQLLWDPNSTELNNNSTPTRSPTGSLNRMFNRHQAEITVLQFRGYSLPVHDCSGTMRPSPCPIS